MTTAACWATCSAACWADTGGSSARPAFGVAFPQVLAAAQADAPWAYRRLFDWLGAAVASYLRGQGASDPDGLANDVFLRAFTNLATFEGGEEGFRSWVFSIAHNVLVDDRRRAARRPRTSDRPPADEAWGGSTEVEALTRLGSARVERLLGELTPDQRDVLLLRIVADLTVEQVAQALDKPPGAVKQLQRRGLATLRRRLGDDGDDDPSAPHGAGAGEDRGTRRTLSARRDVHPPR